MVSNISINFIIFIASDKYIVQHVNFVIIMLFFISLYFILFYYYYYFFFFEITLWLMVIDGK